MKQRFFLTMLTLGMLSIAGSTMASQLPYTGPLMSKQMSPGYSLPEYRFFSKCEVFGDRVVIAEGVDTLRVRRVVAISLEGTFDEAITAIDLSPKTEENGPTDMPTTTYTVFATHGTIVEPVIFDRNGTRIIKTDTRAARTMKRFLNTVCK